MPVLFFFLSRADTIREGLSATQLSFPEVVDLKWRLDYYVKSDTVRRASEPLAHSVRHVTTRATDPSNRPAQTALEPNQRCRFACRQVEQVRKPIYFVTLKTRRGDGTLKDVSFSCTLQEIQDLLFRLKDACKQAAPN